MNGQGGGGYDQNYPHRVTSNASSRYRNDLDRTDTTNSTQPLISSPTQSNYSQEPIRSLSHATFYPSAGDDFFANPYGEWTEEPQDFTADTQSQQQASSEPSYNQQNYPATQSHAASTQQSSQSQNYGYASTAQQPQQFQTHTATYFDEARGGWVTAALPTPATAIQPPPPPQPAFTPAAPAPPKTITVYDEEKGGWITIPAPPPPPVVPVAQTYTPPAPPQPTTTTTRVWDDNLQGWVQRPVQAYTAQYQAPISGPTPPLPASSHSVYSPPYEPPRTTSYSTVSSLSTGTPYTPPTIPTTNTPPVIPSSVPYAPQSLASSDNSRRQSTFSLASPLQAPPPVPLAPPPNQNYSSTSSVQSSSTSLGSHVPFSPPIHVPTPPNLPAVQNTTPAPAVPVPAPIPPLTTTGLSAPDATNVPARSPTPETPVEGGIRLSTIGNTSLAATPGDAGPARSSIGGTPLATPTRSGSKVGFLGRMGSKSGPRRSKTSAGFMSSVTEDEVLDTSNDPEGTQQGPEGQKLPKGTKLVYDDEASGWVPSTSMLQRATTAVRRNGGSLARSMTRRFQYGQVSSGDDFQLKRSRRLLDEQKANDEGYAPLDLGDIEDEMPAQAVQAMKDNQGNTEFAYTATGEILDLSSLQGYLLGEDDEVAANENQPLTRATTGLHGQKAAEEQSYYFPEDPDMPNWKPVTMRPIYLTILQLLALSIIGICEYLYQYSVDKGKRHNTSAYLTEFTNIDDMPLLNFAMWKYLPTVIAVVFGVLVQLTDAEVKRVEPYFQLSRRPKGATAADSLNVEYLTFMAVLCPFQAIKHRHWAIFIASIAAVLSFAAVPPLQSIFLDLNPDKAERMADPNVVKRIVVHEVWTRLLETVYFLIFILIGALQVMIYRRKTGLVGDPSGIAGVAAMACKSHILMDFKGLDQAGTEEIHRALRKRTYILHKSSLWQGKFLKESERPQREVKRQNPHPLFFRYIGAIPLMLYLVGMMIFIPVFLYNKNPGLQVLQNTPWFITALSVSIKMLWEVIDRDLRILQPFFMLYNRHAHSDVLTLDYTATIPGWIIYKTAKNKHYLLTFITTITLLNEVLTVCMGSLGQGGDAGGEESSTSTKISLALSETIIATQIVGISILLYFRRKPFLPRQPGTISSVLAYIYQSHMLKDFSGMEKATTDKRRKMLAALEPTRTYGFGWFKGLIDGQWHLGIDQEELRRGYKHGEPFTDGVLQTVPTNIDVY